MKTTTYIFTFDEILRVAQGRFFLSFPGRYGRTVGPFKNSGEAWNCYVLVLREGYFWFDPNTPVVYEERVPIPMSYVPPTDYQI